jgi:hypothetical protein
MNEAGSVETGALRSAAVVFIVEARCPNLARMAIERALCTPEGGSASGRTLGVAQQIEREAALEQRVQIGRQERPR